jgi:hypothetical protein
VTIVNQQVSSQATLTQTSHTGVLTKQTTFFNGVYPTELTKGGPVWNYRQKIKRGEYAGSNLTVSDRLYKFRSLHARGVLKKTIMLPGEIPAVYTIDGMPILSGPAVSVSSLSNADSKALTKLAKKTNELLTTFQGGVFVGELAQTIRQIRHPAEALRRGFSSYLRDVAKRGRKIKKVRDMQRMVTGTYLEYTFGWQPLVNDLDAGAEILAELITDTRNRDVKTIKVAGSDHQAKEDSDWAAIISNSSPCVVEARGMRTHTSTVKYLACYLLEPSTRKSVMTKIGLNLANFVPTLWELVPWSFVVDYFTNIGDCLTGLANCSAHPSWVMKWNIVEDVYEVKNFRMRTPLDPANTVSQSLKPGYFSSNQRSISRSAYIGSLLPPLRFEIPGESSRKWINLAALGVQLALTRGVTTKPERLRLTLLRKGTF